MTNTSAAGEALRAALAEAERVVKKQRVCAEATAKGLDDAVKLLSDAAAMHPATDPALASLGVSTPGVFLKGVALALRGPDIMGRVESTTKDFHGAIGKLGKAIDRAFIPDPDRSSAAWPRADPAALDAAIAAHLARTGRTGALAALVAEAGLDPALPTTLAAPFAAIGGALRSLASGDAGPARAWAAAHRDALVAERGVEGADAFEFALVKAAFLDALAGPAAPGGTPPPPATAALAIARSEFGRFARTQMPDIQALMGRLVYAAESAPGGGAKALPARYPPLDRAGLWSAAASDLVRAAAALAGLPSESPLLVAVAAGACALPTLHKLSIANARMGGAGQGGGGGGAAGVRPGGGGNGEVDAPPPAATPADPDANAIPVDLDLGPEFVFRSVFSCPVSREAASDTNPPVLLPCGHALCRASVLSIAHGPSRAFKCPYCPAEATPGSCRPLRFPDTAAAGRGGGR